MGFRGWWWFRVALWTISLRVGPLAAETIHFTNSPKLIMASKNFTTYEIEVPGSKPITIIEATDRFDAGPENDSPQVDSFPTEVKIPGGLTTSFRTSTGLSVSRPAAEDGPGGARKTLYSPELLTKFLKEYSEKLRNADSATRKRLNEITLMNSLNQNRDELHGDDLQYRNRRPAPAAAPAEGIEAESQVGPGDEPKTGDEFVFTDTHERHGGASNKRWYQEGSYKPGQPVPEPGGHKNHPWNVKDGWVTLEAVPWSESKVSKWHAAPGTVSEVNKNVPGKGPTNGHPLDKYYNSGMIAVEDGPTKYRPIASSGSIGASSYYGDGDDDVRQPSESLYNRRRPTVSLYSERPDPDRSRPSSSQQPSLDSWYDEQALHNPYDAMKAYHEAGVGAGVGAGAGSAHRDIITDGRPANFPNFVQEQPHPGVGEAPNRRVRPGSYPDRGNGEWVLISTTKGYQYPKRRQGQRAITFSPASSTSHQTVKLTVLPMKNPVDMTTSHNGLIEVSSSTQTVEDAVKQQKHKRKDPSAAGHRKKKPAAAKPAPQTFSVMRRDAAQDSSAVLAAVGAGMVPATMAILAPMVLGR